MPRDIIKIKNFHDKSLKMLKKRQKSAFEHFRFGTLRFAVKSLIESLPATT
jgi:hypothetical protein